MFASVESRNAEGNAITTNEIAKYTGVAYGWVHAPDTIHPKTVLWATGRLSSRADEPGLDHLRVDIRSPDKRDCGRSMALFIGKPQVTETRPDGVAQLSDRRADAQTGLLILLRPSGLDDETRVCGGECGGFCHTPGTARHCDNPEPECWCFRNIY
ncbi:GL15639 [Drosophila persimilis]|uniref:GL15639 n=1 Tax=Drosophila persimilis TaxID=7234 RepID=B4HCL8_DROPE|nr:GL15639 [Drosophila persimilis]